MKPGLTVPVLWQKEMGPGSWEPLDLEAVSVLLPCGWDLVGL